METLAPLSSPPIPGKPDKYRTEFKTLADRNGYLFECIEEAAVGVQGWWARYRLINDNGSPGAYLGSNIGTSKPIAKEHAAKQALGELQRLINERSTSAN
jgi:hypothetical protein